MKVLVSLVATLAFACGVLSAGEDPAKQTVVFVCEHGNVKSLMAASYFNQLSEQRGLRFRAISRGSAPNSSTVPGSIATALRAEGFDVSTFHPEKVEAADAAEAARIVAIGTELPTGIKADEQLIERWNDVPPASTSYGAARNSLMAHIAALLDRLAPH